MDHVKRELCESVKWWWMLWWTVCSRAGHWNSNCSTSTITTWWHSRWLCLLLSCSARYCAAYSALMTMQFFFLCLTAICTCSNFTFCWKCTSITVGYEVRFSLSVLLTVCLSMCHGFSLLWCDPSVTPVSVYLSMTSLHFVKTAALIKLACGVLASLDLSLTFKKINIFWKYVFFLWIYLQNSENFHPARWLLSSIVNCKSTTVTCW